MLTVSVTGNVARDIIKVIVSISDTCFKACTFSVVVFQVNEVTTDTCQFVKILRVGVKPVIDNNNVLRTKVLKIIAKNTNAINKPQIYAI